MATYVMLAGASAGGWCLQPLASRLRKAGHDVFTPTFTGLGERSHLLNREIDLETHILDVLQVFKYENLQDAILVGESYSGMVITGVADRIPEQVRHLVYLDAAVPDDGQALVDLVDPTILSAVLEVVKNYGEGWYLPVDLSINDRATAHPLRTFTQPLQLFNKQRIVEIPHTYVYGTVKPPEEASTHLTYISAEKAKAHGWNYYELPVSHQLIEEALDDVSAILLALA